MTYSTRAGASRRPRPVESYGELLDQPTRSRRDDRAILLHVGEGEPVCTDCGVGTLRWAEAGYVPWHRICTVCGTHWDLHPLGLAIALLEVREQPTCGFPRRRNVCRHKDDERCAGLSPVGHELAAGGARVRCSCCCHVPPSMRRIVGYQPSAWVDGRGWVPIDPAWPVEVPVRRLLGLPSSSQVTCTGRTWGDLLELVTAEHIEAAAAERHRTLGEICVPACWARRARFYR